MHELCSSQLYIKLGILQGYLSKFYFIDKKLNIAYIWWFYIAFVWNRIKPIEYPLFFSLWHHSLLTIEICQKNYMVSLCKMFMGWLIHGQPHSLVDIYVIHATKIYLKFIFTHVQIIVWSRLKSGIWKYHSIT
jgi:hypothetical protein